MSDIKWLVDILLNYKLPAPVKALFIARIGQIEEQLYKPTVRPIPTTATTTVTQAPSTQRILDEIAMEGQPAPKRIIVPSEVSTGANTRGPRKF